MTANNSKQQVRASGAIKLKPTLNFVVALSCEAKPLIDYYRLKKTYNSPFNYFQSSEKTPSGININLIVSGVGVLNMAAACGWLQGQLRQVSVFLNVGCAGHASLDVGQICRVVDSVEYHSQQHYYPPLVAKWPETNVALLTYNAPCTEYPEVHAVDMEASAYFAVASRFTSAELVQSLKVISDNVEHDIEQLNATIISEIIAKNVDAIDQYAQKLTALLANMDVQSLNLVDDFSEQTKDMHCTVSQRQQFDNLVSKLVNTGVSKQQLIEQIDQAKSMSDLLQRLDYMQRTIMPIITISS